MSGHLNNLVNKLGAVKLFKSLAPVTYDNWMMQKYLQLLKKRYKQGKELANAVTEPR